MLLFKGLIAKRAIFLQQRGNTEAAIKDYEKLYQANYISSAYLVPYSILLLRRGKKEDFEKTKEVLKKAEKAFDITPERRRQLILHYAVAQFRLGETDKAIHLLEASHQKNPGGMTYEALGFMYIETDDPDKALQYNMEAYEYDNEDPITLDNLGQVYYRMLGDKKTAKMYFDRAIALKDDQIDTLYFLSRYDMDEGNIPAAIEKLERALDGNFSPLNFITRDDIAKEIEALKARNQNA